METMDIRQAGPHMSSSLADVVIGTHEFHGLDHETRVFRIYALQTMTKAVWDIGELEHTSDWDWRVSVEHGEANIISGTYDLENDEQVWADTINLPYTTEPGDYMNHFQRWTHMEVEEYRPYTDDPIQVLIPVDQINRITITFA